MSETLRVEIESVVKKHFDTDDIIVGVRNDESRQLSLFISNESEYEIWTSLMLEDLIKTLNKYSLAFIIDGEILNIFEC